MRPGEWQVARMKPALFTGDLDWLRRQLRDGHCGEGTLERNDRQRFNDRIERLIAAAEAGIGIRHPVPVQKRISSLELRVLNCLAAGWSTENDWRAYYFRTVSKKACVTLAEARRACRSLTKKGLAQYERGLFTEDGETAGSGYRATEAGFRLSALQDS